ncbi:PDR/VanB family oxidoreductase [Alkalilimnicola sp. S0819]|uniref:PDR/VanB family oxidoreductase n=1 Tax=Alkalilimnicola sp. S0819 TaxID=2613922 RepID=UPI0012615081|nr:PDR/VanB family oxidoreductase [Alkalilimnicola sp. S0819]KAB7624081.1 oxidoreductase [Alkalilimnicola sp. S0819]MPQ16331.1 2Fe-2S iron-sulfur cluster binding domain-containing protein [Alkalilimnicola sp. S0819]
MSTQVRVKSIIEECEGVKTFVLEAPRGVDTAFAAGAHLDVALGAELSRSYSLVPVPGETGCYAFSVRLAPDSRGGSRHLHEAVRQGDTLWVSETRNNFALAEEAPYSYFFAGGIGITPFLSMLERLVVLDRPWELHYASRDRTSAPFLERLQRLAKASGNKVVLYFDDQGGRERWSVARIVADAAPQAHFYCCGPEGMLADFRERTAGCTERAHYEYFAADTEAATESGGELELARSGKVVKVAPGQTILEALQGAGLDVPFSCREGTCGTCEVGLLEGEADHRDMLLSEEEQAENQSLMVCCSGFKSPRLVLDL